MTCIVTQPRILYVLKIDDKKHKDLLKIGDLFVTHQEYEQSLKKGTLLEMVEKILKGDSKDPDKPGFEWARNLDFKVVEAISTTYKTPTGKSSFTAQEIIDILTDSGYNPVYLNQYKGEPADLWMQVSLDKVGLAIDAAQKGLKTIENVVAKEFKQIKFRPEQKEAIQKAVEKFSLKTGKKYLWNAKMRFGKTLCALEVAKILGKEDPAFPDRRLVKTVLIVTHRPAVNDGWQKDFNKIFGDQNNLYTYGSRDLEGTGSIGDFDSLIEGVKDDGKRLVFFVSMQYLRLSTLVGGDNTDSVKENILNFDWDMVVVDEAHEGTKTDRGQNVIDKLNKENTKILYLSGTPFNLYDDFKDDEIYTWDYVKEQTAKAVWENQHFGDPNPYAELPHLNLFTFDLSSILADNKDEFSDFKFNEFFRTWTGDIKKDGKKMPSDKDLGKFIYEAEVNQFLDLLAKPGNNNFPFSTPEFQKKFRHTFWIVPGVKEAKALEVLLQQHPVFGKKINGKNVFKIVNVAGDGNIEDPNGKALKEVEEAIANNDYTITLSCGKLTTGVSIPQWTAVLYLKGSEMTTAATYMQTIFRVQTHALLDGEQKRECYVFDFAPSRTLRVVAETAKYAVRGKGSGSMELLKESQSEEEEQLTEFLEFCPVIALDDGKMTPYKASNLFAQLKNVYVARAVQSGYADNSLYSADALMDLDPTVLKRIFGKIGRVPNLPRPNDINVGQKKLSDQQEKDGKKAAKKRKEDRTPAEQEAYEKLMAERKEKQNRISVIRGISIRIPLLVYGAEIEEGHEDEELSINNFTSLVDQSSWDEFMPADITKEDFDAIKDSYDPTIFREAAKRIRSLTRAADSMDVEERIERIATIFSYFHNPDKETVLTPWRVVNMHMADTLGGWCFFNKDYSAPNVEIQKENGNEIEVRWPRWVDQGEVTKEVFENKDARLLEINSKTGLYPLYLTYSLYREWKPEYLKHDLIEKAERDDKVIWDSILKDNLFVVCKTPMARAITRRTLVGFRKHDDGSQIQVNAVCPEWELSKKELVRKNILKNPDREEIREDEKYKSDLVTVLRFNSSLFEKDVVNPEWWERGGRELGKKDKTVNIKLDKEIFKDMIKFNAVVGNPPYQINDGSGASDDASNPIYQEFVKASSKISSNYSSLIMPSKWMFGGKPALKTFRKEIMDDPHVRKIVDFENDREIFPSAHNDGGICYLLYDKNYNEEGLMNYILNPSDGLKISTIRRLKDGEADIIIRDNRRIPILSLITKTIKQEGKSFKDIVSSTQPFGIRKDLFNKPERYPTANIRDISFENSVKIYGVKGIKGGAKRKSAYINRITVSRNQEKIDTHKIFFTTSFSSNAINPPEDIVAGPGEVCTETFLMIGPFNEESSKNNCHKFIQTNFFKILLYFGRGTMQVSQDVFRFIPLPDFIRDPEIDWSKSISEIDRQLYKKYGLEQPEIDFIESMIKPMINEKLEDC